MGVPVGVLVMGQHVVCASCFDDATYRGDGASLYPVNLERYDQDCHDCGRVLVAGSFKVQLYDAVKCRVCCEDQASGGLHAACDSL